MKTLAKALRTGEAKFEPRARLLKLLGGELIRDDVMAIVELVKNSHDADASVVNITFNTTRDGSGEILVEDDGDGMDLEDFLTRWMQPAGSRKRKVEYHYTKSGRRVLGEKGVGRFAVDRLGRYVELTSRRKGQENEIVARFDWDEFNDGDRPLSDITSTWVERGPECFNSSSGTLLRIGGLRSRWTERNFRKLSSRLKRLVSPFGNGHDFKIVMASDEFPDYFGAIETSFLDRAPYRISAHFDGNDTVEYRLGENAPISIPWDGIRKLECGPVNVNLHCFDLETESLSRVGPGIDVRAWLREWTGVSIYRDDYRVLPYGEPDDDWLRLDQRRVNNPVVCLSSNQVCGFIAITGNGNPELWDQTNRGGLLQNRAFDDLRALVQSVFKIVEAERQCVRHPEDRVDGKKIETGELGSFVSKSLLDLIVVDPTTDRNYQSILGPRFKAIQKGLVEADDKAKGTIGSYLDLAGIGQTTSFIRHALQPRIGDLKTELETILRKTTDVDGLDLGSTPNLITNIIEELETTIDDLTKYSTSNNRLRTTIDLIREIRKFEMSISQLLAEYGVIMSVDNRTQGMTRALFRPEALMQVLYVLVWNSLEWLEGLRKKRIRIRIEAKGSEECRLIYQDNGPGIDKDKIDQIFAPGVTSKDGNRGMGLTVARDLLRREGGDIVLLKDRRRSGWTSFEITLKSKKSRVVRYD